MNFRYDINGLRAYAVIAVVIFHFNASWLHGGFAGVDVFFVISGYLMTRIITKRYDAGLFSVWAFYLDRGRRIIPALAFLCAVLLTYGVFKLSPIGLMQLAKHVVSSMFFISNGVYWLEAGYFDASSHTKWLLHTWSLSVEWQFYLIYPFIILGIIKVAGRKNLGKGLIAACAVSYLISVATPVAHQSSAFYLIHTRAWEMIAGGLVCLYPVALTPKRARFAEIVGFLMVIASYIWMTDRISWPGYLALVPVTGACMLLAANRQHSALPNNPVCQFLGTTSYSIYLWHWPVVVFMLQNEMTGIPYAVAGIFISVVLGWISYRFVENRMRGDKAKSNNRNFVRRHALFATFCTVIFAGVIVYKSEGLPARYEGKINELTQIKNVYSFFGIPGVWRNGLCHSPPIEMTQQQRLENCAEKGANKLFIWGDSYAGALYPGLLELQKKDRYNFSIEQFTDGNGVPFFRNAALADNKKDMMTLNQEKLDILANLKPQRVVITWMMGGMNSIYVPEDAVAGILDTANRIKQVSPKTKVIVIGPMPHWKENLIVVMLKYWDKFHTYPPKYMDFELEKGMFTWDEALKSGLEPHGVKYISALKEMCNEQGCLTRVGDDVKDLAAVDWGHLTPSASVYLIDKIKKDLFD